MCGLRWCWHTSPGVHLGLIVGRKQMFLPVYVCLCVCTCFFFFTTLKHVCVEYVCVHGCLPDPNISITAETPLCQCEPTWPTCISLCLPACSSVSVSFHRRLLIFIFVLYSNTFKEVVNSCLSDPIYCRLHVSSSMCGHGMEQGICVSFSRVQKFLQTLKKHCVCFVEVEGVEVL